MGYLRYARPAVIVLLALWLLVIIHPFTREGVVITSTQMPASIVLKPGDIIDNINGNPIHSLKDYNNVLSQIKPNDTVSVTVLRETFPYHYINVTHVYVAEERNNETFLGLSVDETHFSHIRFSHSLVGGTKIVLKSNQSNAVDVIKERLSIGKISDFSVKKDGDKIIILASSPSDEVLPLIETKGKFYAKIGNSTFFTADDVENICLTGMNCILRVYGHYNESEEGKSVVWRYEFGAELKENAANRFVDLTKNLTISSCKYDRCMLNESIDYYIDDNLIGSEQIYSESKGLPYKNVVIGGDVATKNDAMKMLYFTQAVIKSGELNADIISVEKYTPRKSMLLLALPYVLLGSVILAALVSFVFLRKIKPALALLGITTSEIIIILGTLAGLNFVLDRVAVVSLMLVGLSSVAIYGYISYVVKKEGVIKSKMYLLSKFLNKWTLIALLISFILIFVVASFAAPFVIYLSVNLLLTRDMFINMIEK
jgi:hypothetical protein